MAQFKLWFEGFETERFKKLQDIWQKTIQTLGGATGKKVLDQPISNIGTGQGQSTFHGKKAILKQLTRANIFQELQALQDPELAATVQQTQQWLGQDQKFSGSVGEFLKMLFGKYYDRLANTEDSDDIEPRLQKVPAPAPPQSQPMPPAQASQPQQPPPPMSMQPGI